MAIDTQSLINSVKGMARTRDEESAILKNIVDLVQGTLETQLIALQSQYESVITGLEGQITSLNRQKTDVQTDLSIKEDKLNLIIDHINSKRDLGALEPVTLATLTDEITKLI